VKKSLPIIALSVVLGLPSVIVGTAIASPRCRDKYAAFVKRINTPTKLDHKPTIETVRLWTRYNNEQLRKLAVACAEVEHEMERSLGLVDVSDGSIRRVREEVFPAVLPDAGVEEQELVPALATSLLQPDSYPTYDNPSKELPDDGGLSPFGGWSGGYGTGGYVPRGPSTGPSKPATPSAPTPEPGSLMLLGTGLTSLAFMGRRTQRKASYK
jgi:hypothetical protein